MLANMKENIFILRRDRPMGLNISDFNVQQYLDNTHEFPKESLKKDTIYTKEPHEFPELR